jgi:hypothetical protein
VWGGCVVVGVCGFVLFVFRGLTSF